MGLAFSGSDASCSIGQCETAEKAKRAGFRQRSPRRTCWQRPVPITAPHAYPMYLGPERQPVRGNYAPTAPNGSAKLRTYSSSSTTPRAKECKRMRGGVVQNQPDRNSVKGPAESEKNLSGGVQKNSERQPCVCAVGARPFATSYRHRRSRFDVRAAISTSSNLYRMNALSRYRASRNVCLGRPSLSKNSK